MLAEYFNLTAEQTDGLLDQVANSMEEAASALGVKVDEPLSYEAVLREANLALAEENLSYQEMTWRLEKALEERDHFATNLRKELELAREVQQSLLPDIRDGIPGVVGINLSAREVSGDFYDFFKLPDGRISFCLADVSGKGMNAALLMAKTSSLYRCLGRSISDPAKLLAMLNREIVETSIRGMFVTMVAGIADPATGEVTLANAGHLPPLHMGSTAVIGDYPALSPPLGIGLDFNFTNTRFNLEGGSLYLYTDGLLEAKLDSDTRLEHEGLVQLLKKYAHLAPLKRVSDIANAVRGPNGAIEDDLTLLLVDGTKQYGLQ
jgi:sigma-B regulation protein RsbU (phosphoserine phosphatase)